LCIGKRQKKSRGKGSDNISSRGGGKKKPPLLHKKKGQTKLKEARVHRQGENMEERSRTIRDIGENKNSNGGCKKKGEGLTFTLEVERQGVKEGAGWS